MSHSIDSLRQMFDQGAFETILKKLKAALKQNPDDWQLWQLQAETHQALNHSLEAINSFEQALLLNPAQAEVHAQLGRLFLQGGWFELAQKHIEAARAFDADSLKHTLMLIECFLLQGQRQAALVYLKEALQLNPESPRAFALLAQTLFLYGRWPEARDALRQALFFDPGDEDACIELLDLALKMNDLAEAQRCFVQDFKTLASSKPYGLYLQACLFLLQGDISQARVFFEQALHLEMDPTILLQLTLSSPWVCQSLDERQKWQQLVVQGLQILTEDLQAPLLTNVPLLAFHPEVQDQIFETLTRWQTPQTPVTPQKNLLPDSLQIGLICSDLNQVACHDWVLGLLQQQTQIQWQVLYLHPGDLPAAFAAWSSQCLQVPDHPLALSQLIRDLNLNGLIYLDLRSTLYQLARAQIVPWQACAPMVQTGCGLKTLATLSETFQWALPRKAPDSSRSKWNLPRLGHLYLCTAPPEYWLPEWDSYLLELLNQDRKAFVIGRFLPGSLLHAQIIQRHASSLGDRQHRVKWVEASDDYLPELISISDMLIEPWEFSTPWSYFQAVSQGIPAFTCPGKSPASQQSLVYRNRLNIPALQYSDFSQISELPDLLSDRLKKSQLKEQLLQSQSQLTDLSDLVKYFEQTVLQEVLQSTHV